MALLRSAFGGEIGLRLLLSPSSSSIVARAACVVVGLGFPVYLSFRALEEKDKEKQEQWLLYWAVYGCVNLVERISDKLISWFPLYHHAKLAFFLWLQLPNNYGVKHIYYNYLCPYLSKHQNRLDRIVDGTRTEVNNLVISHQKEIKAVALLIQRLALCAYKNVEDAVRSTKRIRSREIGGGDDGDDDHAAAHHHHHHT